MGKRVLRWWGLVSAGLLTLVILACGSSGEVDETETESASEGDPFGLVEAINNDLARASEEMGEQVEQANEGLAEASEQAAEATGEAEEALDQAGEETQQVVEEATPE